MLSKVATTLTAGSTLTAFLVASTAPVYAQGSAPTPPAAAVAVSGGTDAGQVQVQGQLGVNPPAAAPTYPQAYPQNYPQGYPQAYPQGYPQGYVPPPGTYPPGYAPAYPPGYPGAPPPYLGPRQRVPIRYEMKPLYSLIIAGSVMFGGVYLTTAGVTGYINALSCQGKTTCSGTYWPLYIPALGPFIYFGAANSQDTTIFSPLLVLSGLAQCAGLAMLIAGAVVRHRVPVYAEEPRLSVAPYFTPTSAGLSALARF